MQAPNSRFSYIFVAISFVSTALLYVYFKNKVDKVDEKLDMMYQLIQSHAIENDTRQGNMSSNQVYQMQDSNIGQETSDQLIEVSENEAEDGSDSDSDDSSDSGNSDDSDDSDNESEHLVLGETTELDDVKKIELNLEQSSDQEMEEEINLKKLSEVDLDDVSNDLNNNEASLDLEVSQKNEQDDEKESDEEESDEEESDEEESENVKQEVKKTLDYSKYKVVELKAFCRDKHLTNYAALKKSELVDLLMSSDQN